MQLFFIVLLLQILAGVEIDLFVPSLPEIGAHFDLTPFLVELTLGLNLLAYCISCLVVGNLGDRYGSRPVILYSLLLFVIGSVFCTFAPTFSVLLLGRVLQGMGIAGPAALSYVILAEKYSAARQQQLLGMVHGILTLAMAFAPVVGSYISLFFHWRGNFATLLLFGLVCFLASALFLPKSEPNREVHFSLKGYIPLLKSKTALFYTGCITSLIASYWLFIGMAPILYMEDLGVSLAHFGFYQGALAGAFCLTSFASGTLLRRFGQKKCFYGSIYLLVLFWLAVAVCTIGDVRSPLLITGAMALASVGNVLPINILYPLALDAVPRAKNRMSAFLLAGRLIVAAGALQIVSYTYNGSFLTIGIATCVMYLFALWFGIQLFKRHPDLV
jgi:DHA1 family bicyclomycin/chloramphenicol resistance-like MFS transporter